MSEEVHYFAYGANMRRGALVKHGLTPLASEAARVEGWRLAFDLPGLPLVEPAFASIVEEPGAVTHGVLYRFSEKDLRHLRRFEAPAYEVIDVHAEGRAAGNVLARAFRNRHPKVGLVPSRRYLRILCEGAREHGLPDDYVSALEAHPSAYVPVVSELATACWVGVVGAMRLFQRRA